MKRISIKELAKMLSLNPSTVSRALSDHPDIRPETKAKVKAAAIEFNYQPNLHAKYFRQKSSGLIAVILPEFNMFFIPELMDGINSVVEASGRSIIIFFSNNSLEREKEIINHCLCWVVDGVLISLTENTLDTDHLKILKDADIPVVLLDKVLYQNDFPTLTIDDYEAANNATTYLIENHKTKILGVFGNPNLEITKKRLNGFLSSLDKNNIMYDQKNFIHIADGKSETLEERLKVSDFDSVFIMSDELLLMCYTILRKLNLYPNQISIVSISDGKLPYSLYPNVTHVKHSGFLSGKLAAETLIELLLKKSAQKAIVIKTKLVVLNSVT